MLLVSSIGWGQLFESFETGLPTSYGTETTFNLASGTWTGSENQVIRTNTGVQSGDFALQLRSQTGSQITTPLLEDGVSTISFYISATTTAGGLQILTSEDGVEFNQIDASPISFEQTIVFQEFEINDPDAKYVRFRRTGSTVRIDDVEINPLVISNAVLNDFENPYEQNFALFTSSDDLPNGWSNDDTYSYGGDFGAGTAGGLRGNGVLGFQLTGSSPNSSFTTTLELSNNTGETINNLNLSYLGKVERVDQSGTPKWEVSIDGVAVDALEYTTANGVDETKTTFITGLSIPNGETFTVSWFTTSTGTSGVRRQIGLTDVSVRAFKFDELPYNEDFSTNPFQNLWSEQNVNGAQNWQWNSNFENVTMNAFSGECQENENWLISPFIDLSSNNLLKLDIDVDETFSPGAKLEVLYSTDYVEGVPSTSTWETIEVIASGEAGQKELYFTVDPSDEFVRVAFLYDYTEGDCSRWELNSFNLEVAEDIFFYDGAWSPSNPVGTSTATDNILIVDGSVDITGTLLANNLEVATGATLNVTSSGVLDLAGNITNNGDLVFQSDASGSGQLANFSGSLTGDITVERFIPAKRAFRFVASPIANVNIADAWQQQTHITGTEGTVGQTSAEGFDETLSGAPSMFIYDHSLADQINNNAWVPIASTTQDIQAGQPYRLFVRGDRSIDLSNNEDPATDVTLSATGTLHTGTFNVETSNFADNFTFVGNPYQAVVDLNNLTYGDGVNNTFAYYWDPALGTAGGFVTTTLSTGTPDPGSSNADEFLRPGQAVFIRNNNTGTDYSIQFNEDDKDTSGSQLQVFSEATIPAYINVRIYKTEKFNNNQAEEDAFGLRFSENGNNELDHLDAIKMGNSGINLASVNDNKLLAIENRSTPQLEENIALLLNNLNSEAYTFTINVQNFGNEAEIFLKDKYTDQLIALDQGMNEIEFTADASIPESVSILRFEFVFGNVTLSNEEFNFADNIQIYPNPVQDELNLNFSSEFQGGPVQIQVFDLLGRQMMQSNVSISDNKSHKIDATNLNSGIYFVKLNHSNKNHVHRFIKL